MIVDVEKCVLVLDGVDSAHTAHVASLLRYYNACGASGDPQLYVFARSRIPFCQDRRLVPCNMLRHGNTAENLTKVQGCGVFVPRNADARGARFCVASDRCRRHGHQRLRLLAVDQQGTARAAQLGAAARQNNNFLAAQRKDERNVTHNHDPPDEIDFKHTVADVAAIARVLVVANIVAEGGKERFSAHTTYRPAGYFGGGSVSCCSPSLRAGFSFAAE